ncbi:MAG: hypothetical protein LLF89_08000 [Spirochaetaceae bacterium]|nr:hypothetical protein [Spirochaetaceae bacterium]
MLPQLLLKSNKPVGLHINILILALLMCFFSMVPLYSQESQSIVALETNVNPVPEGDAIIALKVNGKKYGDVDAKIDMDDPFIKVSVLKEALSPSLSPDQKERIFSIILSKLEWAGIADLAAAGIQGTWDMETLSYSVVTPGEYTSLREIDFTPEIAFQDTKWLDPAPVAGVINFNVNGAFNLNSSGLTAPVTVSADSLLDLYSVAIEAHGSMVYTAPSLTWSFNNTRAVYDFPSIEGRLFVGMISGEGLSYQSRPEIYGVSLHNVDDFSRYSMKYSPSVAFTLQNPSSVRFLINGQVIRTLKLDRGNYRIYDLPFAYGLNNMEIEVEEGKNPDGSILYKPVSKYITTETGLLVGGQMDYGFSAGIGRSELDQPIVSGYFRYGLTSSLTVGANLEADRRSLLAGATMVAGTSIGGFILNAASLVAWDDRTDPFAFATDLEYHLAVPGDSRMPGVGFTVGYASSGFTVPQPYSTVADPEPFFKTTLSIGGSISKIMSYGLAGSWNRTLTDTPLDSGIVSLNLGFAANKNVSFSMSSGLEMATDDSPAFTATFALRVSDPAKPSRQIGMTQTADGENTITYNDQFPNSSGIGYGITAANIFGGVSDPSSVSFNSGFTTQYFSFSGNAGVSYGSSLTSPNGLVNLNVASALAFAGSSFAISKPLYDSFIIFAPDKSTENMTVAFAIDQGTKLISHGAPVAAPFSSYHKARASMDFPEAAADVVATLPQIALSSKYRSGFLFKGGLQKYLYAQGRLVDKAGAPIPLMAGDVLKADGTLVSQTFTDDSGTFQIYELTEGEYKIAWPDSIGISIIKLSDNGTDLVELGDIKATPTNSDAAAASTSIPATEGSPANANQQPGEDG